MSYEEHHSPGWHTHTRKMAASDAIAVPSSTASGKVWTVLDTFREGELEEGKTHFEVDLRWNNPAVKPKDIKVEWVRRNGPGPSDDDPTGRKGLIVGSETSGADTVYKIEDITPEDLPFDLVCWQVGPATPATSNAPIQFTTVISKAHNPKAEIAGDLA